MELSAILLTALVTARKDGWVLIAVRGPVQTNSTDLVAHKSALAHPTILNCNSFLFLHYQEDSVFNC